MLRRFRSRSKQKKVLVLGLDCVGYDLLFNTLLDDLPHLKSIIEHSSWGILESCIPCITVPAWSVMMSGADPGELGVYGFRNRKSYRYDELFVADANAIQKERVWDATSRLGLNNIVLSVPQTYPVSPLKGKLVSGFLSPNTSAAFTYPAILKQDILKEMPQYQFDVRPFRTENKNQLLQSIYDFNEQQFRLVIKMMESQQDWQFFMHVNMATDRLHHGFWRYHDPEHRLYQSNNPFQHAIRDFYKSLDYLIGEILKRLDDHTALMIVSDHGVKRMDGAICINEWLRLKGWLHFKNPIKEGEIIPFDLENVDWSKTRAWSTGGYYGRIFLNVAGREPEGIIAPEALASVKQELSEALEQICDDQDQPLATQVFYPEEIYRDVQRIAPDLMVYFGDLHWRTVGGLGYGQHFCFENDTGPDDANHAMEGIYIFYDPQSSTSGKGETLPISHIKSRILAQFK